MCMQHGAGHGRPTRHEVAQRRVRSTRTANGARQWRPDASVASSRCRAWRGPRRRAGATGLRREVERARGDGRGHHPLHRGLHAPAVRGTLPRPATVGIDILGTPHRLRRGCEAVFPAQEAARPPLREPKGENAGPVDVDRGVDVAVVSCAAPGARVVCGRGRDRSYAKRMPTPCCGPGARVREARTFRPCSRNSPCGLT